MRKIFLCVLALLSLCGCEKSLNLYHVDSYDNTITLPDGVKENTPEFDEWFEREVHRQFTPKDNTHNAGACTFHLSADNDKYILSVENNTESTIEIMWDYILYNGDIKAQTCDDTMKVIAKENRIFDACKKIGAKDKITAYLVPKNKIGSNNIKPSIWDKNNIILLMECDKGDGLKGLFVYKLDFDFSLLKSVSKNEEFTLLENYKYKEEKEAKRKKNNFVTPPKFEIVTAEK